MDRINFDRKGGYPMHLEDFKFNNDGIERILKAMCEAQMCDGDTYTWIGNAELDGGDLTWTDGVVFDKTNDEIYFVDAGSVSDSSFELNGISNVYCYLVETNDGVGLTFKDGITWYPRKYKRITFNTSTYNGSGVSAWRGLFLSDLVDQKENAIPYSIENDLFGKTRNMNRWKYEGIASNLVMTEDDQIEIVEVVSEGSDVEITLPNTRYNGEKITIYNTCGTSATITSIGSLATSKAGVYAVNSSNTWVEVATWDID